MRERHRKKERARERERCRGREYVRERETQRERESEREREREGDNDKINKGNKRVDARCYVATLWGHLFPPQIDAIPHNRETELQSEKETLNSADTFSLQSLVSASRKTQTGG